MSGSFRKPRLSGLQRQVLSLYRSVLRASHAKEQAGGHSFAAYARQELDRNRGIDRKDIQRIEHMIRKGRRQLSLFMEAETSGLHLRGGSGSSGGSSSMPPGQAATAGAADAQPS